MPKYKHIFFDLDRTLWDYERNARETIRILLEKNDKLKTIDIPSFFKVFDKYNEEGWSEYLEGKIKKEDLRIDRFSKTLKYFLVNDLDIAAGMAKEFILLCPRMPYLAEGSKQVLEYLSGKYQLHILTNGFSDIQFKKLRFSGIEKYFDKVITSDAAGSCKPNKEIFHYALSSLHASKESSLIIGDDYKTDIEGAMNFGIDQVWINPERKKASKLPTYNIAEISDLITLKIL
jgi:putative hydrolase of the HAD superfamily